MADGQKPNKPLFSQHYLEHRIQECPEWQVDVAEGFKALKKLYDSEQQILPSMSEDQTEERFIIPVLKILGFGYVVEPRKSKAERPDYALFVDDSTVKAAIPLQGNDAAFYTRTLGIAEAKYWGRPLSKVSSNDQRDIYKNANPSFQISSYLAGTGVDWGILTNGREWRLYYRQASSTATEFYPVDLVELLEAGDLEQFKYFWLFFRQAALVKDPQGRNFLERVREGSTTYAQRVGNKLKALVFDRVFPGLAGGFVADAARRGEQVTPDQLYEATLSFLYKLLFLLYAEARNLLPIDRNYRDHSLIKMAQEVAVGIKRQKKLSQTSTGLYDRLLSLFQIVDRGDSGLDVPRYNGGLFHVDFSQPSDRTEYRANHFLFRFKLSDAVLAPVLDQLARFEGQPIDYSFLGVRQLGSIYEGLLEYRVVIEDAPNGQVQLENDKGDRKATGSYYTPDYIVKYIVSHTLKPILEQRQARFGELMAHIAQLHTQMQDQRLGVQSLNGLRKDLQRLEREAQSTLLDIKVCDPAMGSGYFLVEAVDYLTDELIRILTLYPEQNPVLDMLEQTRQSILQNLQQQGISINPDRLEPTQLLQRVVMKRCIYGVDLNPMAVELAKVSLWLHSFTIGAPLSFLDHHLRCGNSLIGTTAREAEASMSQEEGGQFNLLSGPFVGLLRASEIMRGVSVLSDATFAEVEQSETLFRSFDEAAKPYKRLLDIYVSKFFGLKRAEHFLRVYGTNAISANSKTMNAADAAVYDDALKLSEEKHFFHWALEFPEVFIDLENASWKENPGFDAVVGNPPYFSISSLLDSEKDHLKATYSEIYSGNSDILYYFISRDLNILKITGILGLIVTRYFTEAHFAGNLRNFILSNGQIKEIVDFGNFQVFPDADVLTNIVFIQRLFSPQSYTTSILQLGKGKYSEKLIQHSLLLKTNTIFEKIAVSSEGLTAEPWNFSNSGIRTLKRRLISQSDGLKTFCLVVQAMQTGKNEVFVIEKELANQLKLEKELLRKVAKTGNIQRFYIENINKYLIWSEVEDIKKYPNIMKYLSSFQNVLSDRYDIKARRSNWWRISTPRSSELFDSELPRLLTPFMSTSNKFCLDTEKHFNDGGDLRAIFLKENVAVLLTYILSILNSRLGEFYHQSTAKLKRDGYYEYYGNVLENFPIRKISFTTPTDHRQQALQNAIALYNQFQLDHNADPLLARVNHHLNQQPEEADVIHDLLAHLAEQMIELNKQKQTEIKSFLQWLERFIGCPIDALTNKSKIQNYLGDYYKKGTGNVDTANDTGEPHLGFNTLIELLKKNKKKITIDPIARREQETLQREYRASLETLLPIKMQLMQCDRLIDSIVYKLYGLTEEEVAIVEGRNSEQKEMTFLKAPALRAGAFKNDLGSL